MKFISSCQSFNPSVNLERITFVSVTEDEHLESCCITFNDRVWRYYKSHEKFKFDLETVRNAMKDETTIIEFMP